MNSRLSALLLSVSALALSLPSISSAQVKGEVGRASDVVIQGSILEPEKLQVKDDAKLTALIKAPEGFKVEVFARDLINPRMLAVSDKGILYATRRSVGDVIMLKDEDGDGKADGAVTVASRPGMHGIAFDGNTVFLVTIHDVYTADVKEDGTFGPLKRIINDLPDAGQHANRTLGIGPDGMLYIGSGSTCNECQDDNPENATVLRASKDGASRSIFASGLRNTIGFDWEPTTGALYGMDHGIDWLGDEVQVEELNRIEQGKKYGWPYVYGMSGLNPRMDPPEGVTLEDWAKQSTEPGRQRWFSVRRRRHPDVVAEMPASKIAIDLVDAKSDDVISVKASFGNDQPIPVEYAADGDNASPAIEWSNMPEGAKSFVIICDDPDAAKPKPFTHWLAYDIPAATTKLREGIPGTPVLQEPKDMKQGANSMGSIGYTGPKPPVGDPAHHYHFQVFALDVETLGLEPGAKRDAVLKAIEGHVLAEGQIVGTFERKLASK